MKVDRIPHGARYPIYYDYLRLQDGPNSFRTVAHVECRLWVCAVTRRRFPVGARPTRQPLQPEATGAVMEVTKWLRRADKLPLSSHGTMR